MAAKRSRAKPTSKKPAPVKRVSAKARAKARSEAARKGWETRARNLGQARFQSIRDVKQGTGELRELTRQWSDALMRARDTNSAASWARFRRLDARRQGALDAASAKKKWRRAMQRIEDDVEELFDIDPDTYDATETE